MSSISAPPPDCRLAWGGSSLLTPSLYATAVISSSLSSVHCVCVCRGTGREDSEQLTSCREQSQRLKPSTRPSSAVSARSSRRTFASMRYKLKHSTARTLNSARTARPHLHVSRYKTRCLPCFLSQYDRLLAGYCRPSVRLSDCDDVYHGAQGQCIGLKVKRYNSV